MNPIDQLKAVLCDPSGKCCIDGSDEDRAIIDRALKELAKPEQNHGFDRTASHMAGEYVDTAQAEQEPVAWDALIYHAESIIESKVNNRFIKGTPLENDVAVWMAEFAQHYIARPDVTLTDEGSKPKPVGSVVTWLDGALVHGWFGDPPPVGTLLYTAPPASDYHEGWEEGYKAASGKREWVGLTDEEAMDAYCETPPFCTYTEAFIAGIRFIEAKLRSKNT